MIRTIASAKSANYVKEAGDGKIDHSVRLVGMTQED